MVHTSTEQPEALRLAGDLEQFAYNLAQQSARELRRLHARVQEIEEDLRFVERWAVHHGTKPSLGAKEALSAIQHYPAISEITDSYADGKRPNTFNPYARIAELEAAQAQRVPLISDSSKVISDEELERAFAGTNFGTKDYRSVLHTAVLKKACGYYCGHTITQIMKELRLIGAKGSPIKRGIEFLRASYHQQMVNGA